MNRSDEILHYWFGDVEQTLPTQDMIKRWFGGSTHDNEIREKFAYDLERAILGECDDWEQTPRGTLALIILFDQFSRHLYRGTPLSYAQDQRALDLCLRGIEKQHDHVISLIERAFFYMPLMHSENIEIQATSIRAFKILLDLSFAEARGIFESFLEYALEHFDVIKRFGRFPHRNEALGRVSTPEEIEFLKVQNDKAESDV